MRYLLITVFKEDEKGQLILQDTRNENFSHLACYSYGIDPFISNYNKTEKCLPHSYGISDVIETVDKDWPEIHYHSRIVTLGSNYPKEEKGEYSVIRLEYTGGPIFVATSFKETDFNPKLSPKTYCENLQLEVADDIANSLNHNYSK